MPDSSHRFAHQWLIPPHEIPPPSPLEPKDELSRAKSPPIPIVVIVSIIVVPIVTIVVTIVVIVALIITIGSIIPPMVVVMAIVVIPGFFSTTTKANIRCAWIRVPIVVNVQIMILTTRGRAT